jgi:hypothetical protein
MGGGRVEGGRMGLYSQRQAGNWPNAYLGAGSGVTYNELVV